MIVSFSFESVSRRDLPSYPKIIKLRPDLSWDLILSSLSHDKHLNGLFLLPFLSFLLSFLLFLLLIVFIVASSQVAGFTSHPIGYWTTKNMRLFLERFAKHRNLDPLVADTWYQITRDDIKKTKVRNNNLLLIFLLFINYYY